MIWGHIESVNKTPTRSPLIQVKTFLPGGIVIRVRAYIGPQTLITRGTEPVDVLSLREGEFVEVSYRYGREGRLNADSISVRSEQTIVG